VLDQTEVIVDREVVHFWMQCGARRLCAPLTILATSEMPKPRERSQYIVTTICLFKNYHPVRTGLLPIRCAHKIKVV
jgi:hypothetical protein